MTARPCLAAQHASQSSSTFVQGTLSHGKDLTRAMVGPAGLGIPTSALRKTAVNGARITTWPTDGLPSWIPNAPYIYDNNPANHGGIVQAGGIVIDGLNVPEGTWVAQFNDFDEGMLVAGNNDDTSPKLPGIMFRGCRWRGAVKAPGYLNVAKNSNTVIWLLFCEAGGLGPQDIQYNEVPFSITDATSNSIFLRNYISYTTTAIQPGASGPQIIENYVEKITLYYNGAPPPGETWGKHLNGISLNGGAQKNALVLRNKVLLQSPDDAGRLVNQTDCIAFFQDSGSFRGTGTNIDGSVGYLVKDNYIGGGAYCIYAGMNAGKPADSVRNMVLIGNQVTTQWWPSGGSYGPLAAQPVWNSYGNVKSNNTFAESGKAW